MRSIRVKLPFAWSRDLRKHPSMRCVGTSASMRSLPRPWKRYQHEASNVRKRERVGKAVDPSQEPDARPSQERNDLHVGSMWIDPIAHFRSCFRCSHGAPRQGRLAPSSKGIVVLDRTRLGNSFVHALEGLDEFSHLWLVYSLHLARQRISKTLKVSPPRLQGRRIGVFATRAPLRPTSIGMSAVRIESVDARAGEIRVSGVDLIDCTPIFDIKPYCPEYDCFNEAITPSWMASTEEPILAVEFSAAAQEMLESHKHTFKFYDDTTALKAALEEALKAEPAYVFTNRYKAGNLYYLGFDAFQVGVHLDPDEKRASIVDIRPLEPLSSEGLYKWTCDCTGPSSMYGATVAAAARTFDAAMESIQRCYDSLESKGMVRREGREYWPQLGP